MRTKVLVALLAVACAMPALARELEGVVFPETVKAGDTELVLNGTGLRIKKIAFIKIKVYAAGLYLPAKTADAAKIVAADEPKRLIMHFLYKEVSRDKLVEAWDEGFAANSPALGAAVKERLDTFMAMWTDMKSGDEAVMTYIPGTGTQVEIQGKEKGVIPGADFAQALFSVWLGPNPPNAELKAGLLGS